MGPSLIALALVAAACGAGEGGSATSDAAAPDAPAPDALRCEPGAPPSWLADHELEVLSKLAGVDEIAPGVTLTARASAEERDRVRAYLVDELERWGLAVELESYATGANVIARLPASVPGAERVVLGAHFDGVPVGPAAADDGTGVALVVAAARHYAAAPCRAVELEFALFDEEEKGLIGSTVHADALVAAEVPLRAIHIFDMISFDGDADGAAELWSPAPSLLERYQTAGAALGVPIEAVDFEFSDHQPFVVRGLPVTGVSEEFVSGDHTPHYHQPTDTVANVDLAYLAAISRLALAAIDLDVGGGFTAP